MGRYRGRNLRRVRNSAIARALICKQDSAIEQERDPKMGQQTSFHAPHGGADFLGFRKGRSGATEIVYDDGVTRRMVWRVAGEPNETRLSDALRVAVGAVRVLPTLYDELKKRAIAIERVAG